MDLLTKFKHDATVEHSAAATDVKHESHLKPPTITKTQEPPTRRTPSPEPERDLLTKLIAGSGHHHSHSHSSSRPTSSSSSLFSVRTVHSKSTTSTTTTRLHALAQREAELRHQLDLLTKEKTETEGYFATLRARFDAEAEWDKNEAHAAETPGEFWNRFAAGEEMERRREWLFAREGEVRGLLDGVERERREIEEGGGGGCEEGRRLGEGDSK